MADPNRNGLQVENRWPEIKDLYFDLIDVWYGDKDRRRSRRLADRLDTLIERQDPDQDAILGQDCRAMICEVRGDLAGAIRHRLKEIRFAKRLLQISSPPGQRSSAEKYALKGRDYADLADRYDLLAILYRDAGQLRKAIRTLWQSRELCELHGIKFDGKGLLRDYLAEYRANRGTAKVAQK